MATQSLNNPFADYGNIITGNRFIGRSFESQVIENRIFNKEKYGNVAIMGLPRIGKTSLAWHVIMEKEEKLRANNTIPLFISVGKYNNSHDFFYSLVALLNDELEFIFSDSEKFNRINSIAQSLMQIENQNSFSLQVQKYFKFVKRIGYKVIFILDEFDSIQKYFSLADFQMLRELSISPDVDVCLVTCSRKTIKEIEATNGAISNFYNTFQDIRLGVYNNDDIKQYWNWVKKDFSIDEEYIKKAEFYVGRHPFLLDLFNNFCYISNNNLKDNDILPQLRLELLNQFSTIQDTLKNEGILDKAIQLVVGPVYNVSKIDEEKLLKYDFIKVVENEEKVTILGRLIGASYQGKSYTCFSDFFTNVLERSIIEDVNYWPIWTETEKLIRNLIKTYVEERYGIDWETKIEADFASSQKTLESFNALKSLRDKSKRMFQNASDNLIDYTLTRDMYNVFINTGWLAWFNQVFGSDKKAWSKKFDFLAEIRNPMAHNNSEFISEEQKTLATNYCQDIKNAIIEWGNKRIE